MPFEISELVDTEVDELKESGSCQDSDDAGPGDDDYTKDVDQ